MTVYWIMYAWPALVALIISQKSEYRSIFLWSFFALVYVILVGLRTEVGGDWVEYQDMTQMISFQSLGSALSTTEAGFAFVTWISAKLGWDVYGTQTFCGAVLIYATVRFARRQPYSWLSMASSIPYLIIVIGMGYVRQAAAIGFIMLALLDFEKGRRAKSLLYIVLATLFHTSALVIAPFLAIITFRRNVLYVIPTVIASLPAVIYLLNSRIDAMMVGYVQQEYGSSGTLVRLFMNAVPATLFLLYRKRFRLSDDMKMLWSVFATLSYLLFIGFALSPSSTLVDRLGLYIIPIQLFVAGHLPEVLSSKPSDARLINFSCVIYFGLVEFVWLNYAENSFAWLPYRSLLTA